MWVDSTPKKRSRVKAGERAQPDWRAALYHGHPAAGETSPDYLPPPTIPARPVMLELETLEAPILAEPEQPMLSESEQPSLSLLDVDDSPEPDPVSATRHSKISPSQK